MSLGKLKELIKNAEEFKNNPACRELGANFEALVELMEQANGNEKLDADYFKRFSDTIDEFWVLFDQAAQSFGIPGEILKAHLDDPGFFPEEQWKMMEILKQDISGQEVQKTKKLKIRKNGVRI